MKNVLPIPEHLRELKLIFAVLCALSMGHAKATANSILSAQTGNWNDTPTWVSGVIPIAGDSVTINDGHIVTVDADAFCAELIFVNGSLESGVELGAGVSMVVSGSVHINNSSVNNNPKWVDVADGFLHVGADLVLTGGASGNRRAVLLIGDGTAIVAGDIGMNNTHARITFTAGGTLHVRGAMSSNGIFLPGAGTVVYDGASPQVVADYVYNNLTIDNSADVTLEASIPVNGILSFSAGKVILGDWDLTIPPSGSIEGNSMTSYIVTNGAGRLIRTAMADSTVSFPVGTMSTYNPATIQPDSASDVFSVMVADSVSPASGQDDEFVQRAWMISEATPGGNGDVVITLQWNGSDEGAAFMHSSAVLWGYNGSSWEEEGEMLSLEGSDPYTATVHGLPNMTDIAVGNSESATAVDGDGTPMQFGLHQNYPNPFNPSTVIGFEIPSDGKVTLKVYDLLGKEVLALVDGVQPAGYHEVSLDASKMASGMYFYRLTSGSLTDVKKLVVVR